ncbi:MAG: amylo-alpha-1,6-glucosidase [Gallionella sp.]
MCNGVGICFINMFIAQMQLRSNQIFAVALSNSPLKEVQQKAVLDVCARELLTSHGLRSLPRDQNGYIPVNKGNSMQRDVAYH